MGDSELLPCPFCGKGDKLKVHRRKTRHYDEPLAAVKCNRCGIRGRYQMTDERAMVAWNRRAAVTDQQFAYAVHDGRLWVCVEGALESDELKPIPGFTRDSIYRDSMQEYGEWMDKAKALMRDMSRRIPWSSAFYDGEWHRSPTDELLAERLREFGIGDER